MSSSYENLSRGRYFDISRLEKLVHEWDLGIPMKHTMDCLYIDFPFLDMFLSLQSFTTERLDATQKIQALWDAAEFERINGPNDLESVLYKLKEHIWETKLEIKATYSFPKASLPLSSNVATPEFVMRYIDTVVLNLTDLLPKISVNYIWHTLVPWHQIEEVVKELKLLRNFVYFILDRCTDPQIQHTFFTHVLVVAGHVAMVSWLNVPNNWNWKVKDFISVKMNASFSDIQKRILQPRVRKIYIDVLKAIKSGCHPNIQAEHVADYKAGFLETLVHHMEKLHPITKHKERVAFKDQITMLDFLRANLINLPREVLEDFDTAIINVGLLVYSMFDSMSVRKLNQVPVLDFSGDIQSIQALIYFLTRKSFRSNLPKIDGLGSIDIILDHLKELLSCYSESLSSIRIQLRNIQQQLEHFQNQHDGSGSFGMQVIIKAYEVDYIIVGCTNRDIPEWCLILWTGDIIEELTKLMREVAEIHEKKVSDLVLHNTTGVASVHTSELSRSTSTREEMVGFQEVRKTLRCQLIRGSSHLDVISIVGMAGLGKTTLANKLFHDQSVVSHFDVRAQCCVSQVYTRKDLLLTILCGVKKGTVISDELLENELADMLQKLLKVQRYLILIDDVWQTAAWDDLYPCFYDANNGSKIILTTRLADVAYHAKLISYPHFLRLFTAEESWTLLKDKVFNKKSCPVALEDVGQQIAQKCGGLPLSVVLVAGILETMEKEKHCWEQVATNLGPHIQAKSEDIINLSYQELPFNLKPCFLYFGVFLEDEEIQVSKLTWLWIAEGLVKTHKEKLSEDIAEDYLKNLIGRNLVMVSKKSSDGKAKTCRIHDLLLDFCKNKAKLENFLQCIKRGKYDHMSPSISHQKHSILRRLCLNCQGDNLAEWISTCSDVQSFHLMKGRKIALSSIHHASYNFNCFKFLRVLNLEFTVIDSFPEALTCLRYVAVRIAEDSSLSFSSNLWNLETLIVKGIGGRVSLPDTLWKMVKLRHLHVYNRGIFTRPNAHEELLKSPQKMNELRTLASVRFYNVEDANNILSKTPNLQKLRCEVLTCHGYSPAFNNLTKLEMLKLSGDFCSVSNEMNLPPTLKKLTLSNGYVSRLDQIATLSSLVVLKLLHISITYNIWEVTDKQFPDLKFLKLQDLSLSEWNVSDDAFPCLEHLVLRRLGYLEEIPPSFADMPTLKSIEVMGCKESLDESAKAIEKTQVEEMQNCGFELFLPKKYNHHTLTLKC